MTFSVALQKVLDLEGRGFENDSRDTPTNSGITQATYNEYRANEGKDPQSVEFADDAEIADIYARYYWVPMHCGEMPNGLDFAVFQAGVNIGAGSAMRILQGLLGVPQDGAFGPITKEALAGQDTKDITYAYLNALHTKYGDIVANNPSKQVFLAGWDNRIQDSLDFIESHWEYGVAGIAILAIIVFIYFLKRGA